MAVSPKKSHPWRAFNPGWLKQGTDKARADRVIPVAARPIKA